MPIHKGGFTLSFFFVRFNLGVPHLFAEHLIQQSSETLTDEENSCCNSEKFGEEFWNCADIAVLPGGSTLSSSTTKSVLGHQRSSKHAHPQSPSQAAHEKGPFLKCLSSIFDVSISPYLEKLRAQG